MRKLTVQEVLKCRPDFVEGQVWKSIYHKYRFKCVKHGEYLQTFKRKGRGIGCTRCNRNTADGMHLAVEYRTVYSHHRDILNPKSGHHRYYKGMPFFDEWNPKKGGSILAGMYWIINNLGKRPDGCSLHIMEHEKGFVPGNLVWADPKRQSTEKMFKIIAKLKNRIKELEKIIVGVEQCLIKKP